MIECSDIMMKQISTSLSSNNNNSTSSNVQFNELNSNTNQNMVSNNQSLQSSNLSVVNNNPELDLTDYMTQLNLAQLALMEKNAKAGNHQSGTQTAGGDEFSNEMSNLLTGVTELNNNNPLVLNNNVKVNATNSLQFTDCPAVTTGTTTNHLLSPQHHAQSTTTTQQIHSPNFYSHGNNTNNQQQQNLPKLSNFSQNNRMMINCSPAFQQQTVQHRQQTVQNQQQSHSHKQQSHSHQSNSNPSVEERAKPHSVQIKYKFGRLGNSNGQLSSPHGFCLGFDEEIIIADTFNHRVCIFDKTGQFKHQFGIPGKDEGQLFYPRKCQSLINKVALAKSSSRASHYQTLAASSRLVVCDRGSERSRMQIFSRNGQFLSRIQIKYIDIVAGLAVTDDGHIVAVDSVSATLFVISESGECLKLFECGVYMQEPSDIAVHNGLFYICDFKGHCVVVFNENGEFVGKIGNKNWTNYPNGIDIADNGDILCGDSHGNKFHLVVFDNNGKFKREYECSEAKVSRCCGLKITKEGYIVTLAKNNHHMLVLNSLDTATNPAHNAASIQQQQQLAIMNTAQLNNPLNSPSNRHQQQMLPILNSPSMNSAANSSISCKEDLDLNDYMTQYNLTLLAMCDTNNNVVISTQQQQQQQSILSPTTRHHKSTAFINSKNDSNLTTNLVASSANNSQLSPYLQNINPTAQHTPVKHSSTLNASLLEQQLHELSFNDSNCSLMNSGSNPQHQHHPSLYHNNSASSGNRSMTVALASPTPSDSNVSTPNSKTGKITMAIRCKFGHLGSNRGQFSSPHGFCLGADEEIVIADTYNHRICVFNKEGEFLYQFGTQGKEDGELYHPRKVAVTKVPANSLGGLDQSKFVVCDRGNEKSRMQLFNRNGTFLKKISIRYIDIVAGLAITPTNNIVAVDSVMPTVFIISETGELTKWFDCSKHMREPSDIAINGDLYYICDFKGHCVVVFNENGEFLHTIGNETITKFPNGIDISDMGDILVGDSHGNRFHVVVFDRNGKSPCEYECPYVKVSRCCGLKLTSEGYVVTLAKNNHHVLVLNTLFII